MKSSLPFPNNYFYAMMTPKRIFFNRNQFKKWQLLVIFIFLTMALLIPVSVNLMNHLTFSLEDIMPQTFKYLDDEVLLQLKDYPVEHGEMMNSNRHYLNSEQSVGVNLTEKQFEAVDSGVNFKINKMLLKDKSGYEFSVNYTKDFQPQFFNSKKELHEAISEQWLKQNQSFVFFTLFLMNASVIFISMLFLVIGGAFFLYLGKTFQLSSVRSYQESLTIILLSLGFSTLLATIVGLLYFDMTIVLSIQSLGLIIMLLMIFLKTKFQDI
ncbi:hypothetical protein K5X77_02045 [Vagococcus lutrae]|uniref:hypothetical protein n=1 Tax=Vagococcus lutrae TaxID=81947 RepID=UPI000F88E652|nr:hypothetical protein [Vagococcus lutrae]QZN89099.1 hypothetical protein K5X77_02045 [Vagococcus lutrae]RST93244.1 hypothetical protein CBF33_01845 [Vagococcus lutrae]UQF38886.1 hypothetical protein M2904_02615 [Vagococcus lutrae]GEQ61700.1 maltodextrose utilization protein malA [Vagococcus lutrae]GEQ63674.1 maltodextrose utilization protein malA [Vagococcus lutrae]